MKITMKSSIKKFAVTAVGAGAITAAAIGFAGTAAAAGGADVIVNGLKSDGYLVQINGTQSANLTLCTVNNVTKNGAGGASPTALVDIACPDGC